MQKHPESRLLQKCPHCTSTMHTGLYREISRNSCQLDRTMHMYKVPPWNVTLQPWTSIWQMAYNKWYLQRLLPTQQWARFSSLLLHFSLFLRGSEGSSWDRSTPPAYLFSTFKLSRPQLRNSCAFSEPAGVLSSLSSSFSLNSFFVRCMMSTAWMSLSLAIVKRMFDAYN